MSIDSTITFCRVQREEFYHEVFRKTKKSIMRSPKIPPNAVYKISLCV
jgi:hypothetical protein